VRNRRFHTKDFKELRARATRRDKDERLGDWVIDENSVGKKHNNGSNGNRRPRNSRTSGEWTGSEGFPPYPTVPMYNLPPQFRRQVAHRQIVCVRNLVDRLAVPIPRWGRETSGLQPKRKIARNWNAAPRGQSISVNGGIRSPTSHLQLSREGSLLEVTRRSRSLGITRDKSIE
jgi:hypothetical protein